MQPCSHSDDLIPTDAVFDQSNPRLDAVFLVSGCFIEGLAPADVYGCV